VRGGESVRRSALFKVPFCCSKPDKSSASRQAAKAVTLLVDALGGKLFDFFDLVDQVPAWELGEHLKRGTLGEKRRREAAASVEPIDVRSR
jgi:hypothetical protein